MSNGRLNRIKGIIIEEIRKLLLIFAYLWVWLGLFAAHRSIVLDQRYLLYHQGFALINALVLAKVMLIVGEFPIARRFRDKPLIYSVVIKSAIFSTILIAFYSAEEIVVGHFHNRSISESLAHVGGGNLKVELVITAITFVALIPFFAMQEIGNQIGMDELYKLFFIRRAKYFSKPSQSP
jgi:hypothetical protein